MLISAKINRASSIADEKIENQNEGVHVNHGYFLALARGFLNSGKSALLRIDGLEDLAEVDYISAPDGSGLVAATRFGTINKISFYPESLLGATEGPNILPG